MTKETIQIIGIVIGTLGLIFAMYKIYLTIYIGKKQTKFAKLLDIYSNLDNQFQNLQSVFVEIDKLHEFQLNELKKMDYALNTINSEMKIHNSELSSVANIQKSNYLNPQFQVKTYLKFRENEKLRNSKLDNKWNSFDFFKGMKPDEFLDWAENVNLKCKADIRMIELSKIPNYKLLASNVVVNKMNELNKKLNFLSNRFTKKFNDFSSFEIRNMIKESNNIIETLKGQMKKELQ